MAESKTSRTKKSASAFLKAIKEPALRRDCLAVAAMMSAATKSKAVMWGPGIVGFGTRTVTYAGGRQAEWMQIAFAPRKGKFTMYVARTFTTYDGLMKRLGTYKVGGGCIHVKQLSDLHQPTLKKLIADSVRHVRKKNPV
jgi:hypothetical protein